MASSTACWCGGWPSCIPRASIGSSPAPWGMRPRHWLNWRRNRRKSLGSGYVRGAKSSACRWPEQARCCRCERVRRRTSCPTRSVSGRLGGPGWRTGECARRIWRWRRLSSTTCPHANWSAGQQRLIRRWRSTRQRAQRPWPAVRLLLLGAAGWHLVRRVSNSQCERGRRAHHAMRAMRCSRQVSALRRFECDLPVARQLQSVALLWGELRTPT
jgi:hypothetical protein